jgi:hypothetical protein
MRKRKGVHVRPFSLLRVATLGVGVVIAGVVVANLPAIRRYLKVEQMSYARNRRRR